MTEEEYRANQTATQNLTEHSLMVTSQSQSIPTQEELDLMRLGHLHVDAKVDPGNPEMPPVDVQQAYVKNAMQHPDQPVKPIPQPGDPPVCFETPAVFGEGVVGATLNCTMGIFSGSPPTYAYQWHSDAANVGIDANTYLVNATDAGHSMTCVVSATNANGTGVAPPSNAVVIAGASRSVPRPAEPRHEAPEPEAHARRK
jgi:hypothetical protein